MYPSRQHTTIPREAELEVPPARSASPEPSEAAPPPAWFGKMKQRRAEQSQPKNIPPIPSENRIDLSHAMVSEKTFSWGNRLVIWIWGFRGVAITVAVLVHLMLIGSLALIILKSEQERVDLELIAVDSRNEKVIDFVEIGDISNELNVGEDFSAEEATIHEVLTSQNELNLPPVDVKMQSGFQKDLGTGEGDGNDGKGMTLTPGANAVKKGSFTAWTVPADPRPGQRYTIVIKVAVPKGTRKYPLRDLYGSYVVGTDQYVQAIPGPLMGHNIVVRGGEVTFEVLVPGGAELVKDTISIQSQLLKEKQTLEIEF